MAIWGVVSLIISVVSSVVQRRKQKKAEKKQKEEADKRAGFQLTVKGDESPIPIVYGRQLVGGILADVTTRDTYTYTDPGADQTYIQDHPKYPLTSSISQKPKRWRNRFLVTQ